VNDVVIYFVVLVVVFVFLFFRELSRARMEILRKEKELETINTLMRRLSSGEQEKTVAANK